MCVAQTGSVLLTGHCASKMVEMGVDQTLLIEQLDEVIGRLVTSGYSRFMVGACSGFDMMAARAVLNLRKKCPISDLELTVVVPFGLTGLRFAAADVDEFRQVLALADRVVVSYVKREDCVFFDRDDVVASAISCVVCQDRNANCGAHYVAMRAKALGLSVEYVFLN